MARAKLILLGALGLGFAAFFGGAEDGRGHGARAPSSASPSLAENGPASRVPRSSDARPSAARPARPDEAPARFAASLQTATVTATSLRLRASPSTGAPVTGSARQGARVMVLGRAGDWLEVRLASGTQGWMHGDYLSAPQELGLSTDVVGQATVTDGDTIRIGDVRVRLFGIDAPESGQRCEDGTGSLYPCAGRAANALADKIGRERVACREEDVDRYGRMVATCVLAATGEDLNAFMVASGWALAYRTYSSTYVDEETAAKRARRGLWQGRFVAPWDYRGGARLERSPPRISAAPPSSAASPARVAAPSAAPAAGPCLIKGNISENGRIYHVPGSRWYDRTRIDTGAGERWFCSEGEARAAGWRAPRG